MKFAVILFLLACTVLPLNAQPGTDDTPPEHSVAVRASMIKTIGHFSHAWESGSGLYASYSTLYDDNWAWIVQAGYVDFSYDTEYEYSGDPSFTLIPVQVGGRYYILRHWIRPFLSAMSGFNVVSRSYIEADGSSVDESSVHLNFQVGGGLGIQVTDALGVEVLFHYNSHLFEPGVPYNITGLETAASISWNWSAE